MDCTVTIGQNPKCQPKASIKLLDYIGRATAGAWEAYLCLDHRVRDLVASINIELDIANDGETIIGANICLLLRCLNHVGTWESRKEFALTAFAKEESKLSMLKREIASSVTSKILEAIGERKISLQQEKDEFHNLLGLPIQEKAT